jgi:ribosomal protein L15
MISKLDLPVKILGKGEISKAVTIEADYCSKSAYEAIHKVGGTIIGVAKL